MTFHLIPSSSSGQTCRFPKIFLVTFRLMVCSKKQELLEKREQSVWRPTEAASDWSVLLKMSPYFTGLSLRPEAQFLGLSMFWEVGKLYTKFSHGGKDPCGHKGYFHVKHHVTSTVTLNLSHVVVKMDMFLQCCLTVMFAWTSVYTTETWSATCADKCWGISFVSNWCPQKSIVTSHCGSWCSLKVRMPAEGETPARVILSK